MAREGGKDRGVQFKMGSWWARYYVDGKEVREKADNKSQAKALYAKRLVEIREGRYFPKAKTIRATFKELAESYLEYANLHHTRKDDDVPRVQTWIDAFGSMAAEDVKPSQVEGIMAKLKDEGMKPATIHRRLTVLKAVFNRAEREERISKNPVRLVRAPKYDNSIVRWLDAGQEKRLFAALPLHLHSIVTVALHTGCRQEELILLEWRDVDFRQGMFAIREDKASKLSSSSTPRWIPMNSTVRSVLLDLSRKASDQSGKVFSVGHPKSLSRSFAVAVKKAGLEPFRFHDLRHTFASRLAMNGANDRTLQTLGGWKTPRMLLRYAHLGPSHLFDAVESLTKTKLQIVDDVSVKAVD